MKWFIHRNTFRIATAALRLHFWFLRNDEDGAWSAMNFFVGFVQGVSGFCLIDADNDETPCENNDAG